MEGTEDRFQEMLSHSGQASQRSPYYPRVESVDGIRTYRLFCVSRTSGKRFDPLMALDAFEPCAGCIEECIPEHCASLSEWIFSIVMSSDEVAPSNAIQ